MDWYYMVSGERVGPVSSDQLKSLVANGTIDDVTQVWHDGMKDWAPFGTTGGVSALSSTGDVTCTECGNVFPSNEVTRLHGALVCTSCKPAYFQRLKEGGATRQPLEYAGFWLRFLAKMIDVFIYMVIAIPVGIVSGILGVMGGDAFGEVVSQLTQTALNLAFLCYYVYFTGKYGGTLGKMALGLKVVFPDGEPVTYLRAFGRYCTEFLSAITFFIGYIIAAFDDEKRTIHDRIAETRVVRSR